MSTIHRDYLRTSLAGPHGQLLHHTHLRTAGAGHPLLLLHPSPMSSAFMTPVIQALQGQARVIALDTPGYGQSDPLPEPPADLDAYCNWLKSCLDALGLASAGILGSATGAQIGIRFARMYPDHCDFLVVESAVHFSDAETAEIMQRYFPDMTPRADGSHLMKAWEMSSALFQRFPWYDRRPEALVNEAKPEPGLVNSIALAYLVAGPDYDRAYRAAFAHERAEHLQAVTCPTRIMRWSGGLLRKYADRFDQFEWPEHIRMVHSGPSVEERYAAVRSAVAELIKQSAGEHHS